MMKKREILEHIIVIEIFTLLTILAFHKLFIFGFSEYIIGDHGDAWHFIWNFWWVKKALVEGGNIFYTDYLFYPHGTHLYFHTLNLSGIFLTLPLTFVTNNLKLVYNISVLLTFILSGYFMYLFLNYFLNHKRRNRMRMTKVISLLGGCMYAFSPYVVSKALGYFNLLSIQWVPLALLLSFMILERFTFKKSILLALILIILFFTDFHYFYYYFIFIAFYFLFNLRKTEPKIFAKYILSIFFSLSILILIYLPAIFQYRETKQAYVRDYFHTITPYNYFLPSPFTLLYKIFPENFLSLYYLSENYMWVDSVIYYGIGYLILLVLFLSFFFLKKEKLKDLYFLFALFLFSSLVALGSSNPISLFLNNVLRRILPFFGLMPVPSRHSFLALLSLNLIICYLANNFLTKIKKGFHYLFILFLVVLFLMEYFPFYYNSYYHVNTPQLIYNLSVSDENFSILNIPHEANTQGMYLQTIHQKKILDGFVSRNDYNSIKVLSQLGSLLKENKVDDIDKLFKELSVGYIVVNYNYYSPSYDCSFLRLLETGKSLKLIEKSGSFEIYKITIS